MTSDTFIFSTDRSQSGWSGILTAAGVAVPFPEVIEAVSDTPVLLEQMLGVDGGPTGLRITSIDGTSIDPGEVTALPGIRIGGEDGGGFVLRRAIDKQLLFVPDADFSGVTAFRYTIADDLGQSATVLATLSVLPSGHAQPELLFADGTQWATVQEGMDAAIVGALALDHDVLGEQPVVQVYENGSDVPSTRFAVAGDKLKVVEALGHGDDSVIHLRIEASDGQGGVAIASAFEIDVRPAYPVPNFADPKGGVASPVEALLNWLSAGEFSPSVYARNIAANDSAPMSVLDADLFHFRKVLPADVGSGSGFDALDGVFELRDDEALALESLDTLALDILGEFVCEDVAVPSVPSSDGGDL